ncbi:GIY-YIG nuclease family protein [Photobacterium sp. ZSDE20]|uniref:GIY-YIG nuclease family protein n=1 Tax=Photobacterium pectinilyticum TaxID=2906793 RepID=A0ABT1MZQ4_9GAMM|nr:GIY-YIG nuclease family protein [Photobacterium sp. ZSDE20]MCQ1057978.1 GIY-YIG nuclease family protein [Photobacterium sp. ZSDE20]MDD1822510.1 GIY-YIG nuclease family protein [Photobacterium sp. ZSDE20]
MNKSKAQHRGKQERTIYIGMDSEHPEEAKIGITSRAANVRESDTTNHRYKFAKVYTICVTLRELQRAEQSIHSTLKHKYGRLKHASSGKESEWFKCTPIEAEIEVEEYLDKLEESKKSKGSSIWSMERAKRSSSGQPKAFPKAHKEELIAKTSVPPTPLTQHAIESQVIKDCVQRRNSKQLKEYNYGALYFRCPDCHKVTKQISGNHNLCHSCGFDITLSFGIFGVQSLYQQFIALESMNSKQAALFDIHNTIYFENVKRTTKVVERRTQPFHNTKSKPEAIHKPHIAKKNVESSSSVFGMVVFLLLLASFGYGIMN